MRSLNMRAAVYYSNNDIRIENRPMPQICPDELLVRIEASGICGSDVMEWYRIDRVPLILGHEIAGVVEEAGKNVKKYKKGDRISASHHVPCGKCQYCLGGHETVCDTLRKTNFDPGGFCEYLRLPKINVDYGVYSLPDSVSFDEATFIEPLACTLRGQRVAGIKRGYSVLVLGCGIAGLLHISLAKLLGASLVLATDIVDYRMKKARIFGADEVFPANDYTSEHLLRINNGRLADLVIVSCGATSAIKQGLESVERAGTVLFFAATDKEITIPLSINKLFWRNERKLISSYAASPKDHIEALELISSKKIAVNDMITHRLNLS
ncbi:MAG: alcohol dehydrogenase catalytic domain-containing protein, partial [Candidatus Omnitrophica bacterium]|nr:alcohol dehydrogenase catalytic domain-containing protein [Candidatus Omnitrophota bacterium]